MINVANREGIAAVVAQQFEVARQVLGHGLMPIIEPEVNIKSPDRAKRRSHPARRAAEGAGRLPEDQQVMLKLSIPAEPGCSSR